MTARPGPAPVLDERSLRPIRVAEGHGLGRGAALRDPCPALAQRGLVQVRSPDGSGTFALLGLLAGATRPTSGQVLHRPRSVGYAPERHVSELGVSPAHYLGARAPNRGREREGSGADMGWSSLRRCAAPPSGAAGWHGRPGRGRPALR